MSQVTLALWGTTETHGIMSTVPSAWPLCPRPKADESLPSWFERVGYEYAMSPALLLGAVEQITRGKDKFGQTPPAARLYDPSVADRLTALAKLSDTERAALWSSASEWELDDRDFCTYCPHCASMIWRMVARPMGAAFGSRHGALCARFMGPL